MTEQTAVVVREQTAIERVREAVEARTDKIAELLPASMDPRQFVSASVLALSKNPGLIDCERSSIVLAILEAAEVGLTPTGGVGGAHLVPFKGKDGVKRAQLIYDYRGIQYLIREGGGGEVKTVVVYEGDYFKVFEGTENARIRHTPKYLTDDPSKITYVYAVPLDHPEKFEVMTKHQVDAVRARSRAANNGPWVTDYAPQARKTVLKRISAWLPLKPSARAAIERDTERELGFDEDSGQPVKSRTAEVRERVKARRVRPPEAPGAVETPETGNAAPAASVDQQTAAPVVEGDAREVCGESSDPALGSVETCTLEPGHAFPDGKPTPHQSEAGSVWPSVKP